MNIDLSKYKVIYNERVLRALAIDETWCFQFLPIINE